MNCKICNNNYPELSFSVCWDCATAESIIEDGVDMNGNDAEGNKRESGVYYTSMEKLQFLIKIGYKKQKNESRKSD